MRLRRQLFFFVVVVYSEKIKILIALNYSVHFQQAFQVFFP